MLLAILLDASLATIVIAIVALIGGAVNGGSLEFTAYIFLGGMAGVVAVRRGDRLQVFVQASLAVFVVNALVVTVFSLLGARDLRGILELWFASAASAAGSGIATVGTFAVLGSVFGILTVFQLLELANPSQPLLRRVLVETPGTYHHSLMVGNLAERAAEAIGADPLVTRVAAYYHDVGKLANPLAFIENQAGGDNIHDQLEPEVSAQILKQHVADGIDLAYKARLPKALIAYIPQHHGTAIMSYFYARAKELAGPGGRRRRAQVPARRPEAAVARGSPDHARRRRRGVRPLAVRARRAGDPGDGQPDHRGAHDRRPVRRVRPDLARPRADPRGVRRPAARDVPHAGGLPAEHRRRARVPAGGRRRRWRQHGSGGGSGERPGLVTRAVYRGPWRVDLTVRDGVAAPIAGNALARAVADALDAGEAPSPASIGLILSDDAELATLNEAHLGVTGADGRPVVPAAAARRVPRPSGGDGSPCRRGRPFALPPGRRTHLGDIVISVERAIAQAEAGRGGQTGDVRWSPADELRLLAIHGTLHVCGWDHADPTEEAAMRALEAPCWAPPRPVGVGSRRPRRLGLHVPCYHPRGPSQRGIGPCRAVRGGTVEGRRRSRQPRLAIRRHPP